MAIPPGGRRLIIAFTEECGAAGKKGQRIKQKNQPRCCVISVAAKRRIPPAHAEAHACDGVNPRSMSFCVFDRKSIGMAGDDRPYPPGKAEGGLQGRLGGRE
jgi:hypothetical protein